MKGILGFIALFLVITCSQGLKCFNCLYFDEKLPSGISFGLESDSSCKPGKKPDKKLSVDCSRIRSSRNAGNETGVLNALAQVLRDNHPLLTGPTQANGTNYTLTYTCAKLSYDGTFLPTYGGKKIKAMFRSCIRKVSYNNATFTQQCQNGKMDKLTIQDADVRYTVFNEALGPDMNRTKTDVSICTCTKDDCNGALGNIQISIFVMLSSLAVILLE